MRKIFASAAAAAVLTGVSAVPAFASVRPPHPLTAPTVVVSVDDEHGVLTTASPLHVGERLAAFGYTTGTFTVTSVRPAGALDRITLSPALNPPQSSEVIDFHIAG